jgi:hypothetical protein
MTAREAAAERARRHRERKCEGIVLTPQYEVMPSAIALLVKRGWLAAGSPIDMDTVGEAISRLINQTLANKPEAPSPPPFRRALKSVLRFGIF